MDLTLEPMESVLLRFGATKELPARLGTDSKPLAEISVATDESATPIAYPVPEKGQKSPCTGTAFQGTAEIPTSFLTPSRRAFLVCEFDPAVPQDAAAIRVNGTACGGFIGKPYRINITQHLKPGRNTLRIESFPVNRVTIQSHGTTVKE